MHKERLAERRRARPEIGVPRGVAVHGILRIAHLGKAIHHEAMESEIRDPLSSARVHVPQLRGPASAALQIQPNETDDGQHVLYDCLPRQILQKRIDELGGNIMRAVE
jgi:hypothetical protein